MDFGTFRRLLLLPPRRLLRPPWFPSPWLFWPLLPPRPRPREPRERLRRLVFSPWFLFSELFSELPEFSFFCTAELVAELSGAWKTGEAASFEAVSCAPQVDPPFGLPYGGGFGIHSFFKDSSLLHRLTKTLKLVGICAEYWQSRISNFNALHPQGFLGKCYASETCLLLRQRDKSLCVNFPCALNITTVKSIPQFC